MCCWYLCFVMVSGRHVDYNFESHFSCLNRHFLKKNPWAHILSIFVYTLVVSFFSRKRLAHADLIRRRCQREAEEAVVYILHTARSWAQLRASPADRPQSEQIWCSQVIGGRPRDLHQYGKGGTPSRTSHATRKLLWPVHYPAYAQRGRRVRDGAGEQLTGYSAGLIWCKPRHSWWSRTTWCPESFLQDYSTTAVATIDTIAIAATISTELDICPACKDTYGKPKSLPCLHAFCVRCLERLYRDKSPGDRARCPGCRDEGIKRLRYQFILQQLIDRERERIGRYCEMHTDEKRKWVWVSSFLMVH